jgi:putative hemolysin
MMQAQPVVPSLPPMAAGPLIDPCELLASAMKRRVWSEPLARALSQLLGVDGVNRLYARVAHLPPGIGFYQGILRELNVEVGLSEQQLAKIPARGPLLMVANHPLGALEGVVLILALSQVRPDARVMANYLMARVPQLAQVVIPVNPFGGAAATRANLAAMRDCLRWLRQGGAVAAFPAGEVSSWNPWERRVEDRTWNPNVARLARSSGATVVPVYFSGSNGLAFHLGGMLHPRLRTAQLARELLGKRDRQLDVHIGSQLKPETLACWGSDEECIAMMRHRTYLLAARKPQHSHMEHAASRLLSRSARTMFKPKPVGPAQPKELLEREISGLPACALLTSAGEHAVFIANASQCPGVLQEIGMLRERTFREVGEGSRKPIDLDRFDRDYQHLFLWNRQTREIIGAYRLSLLQESGQSRTIQDSYIGTLFHFSKDFGPKLGPAIELGRSFIRREYQRSPSGLMLLWKGIAAIARQNPLHAKLIGPVSISNDYSNCSRQILVEALTSQANRHPMHTLVRPRRPFRHRRLPGWRPEMVRLLPVESQSLSALIAEIENDGKGLPVLLRQYLNLGGAILGFNVDSQFSRVLDGLIVVDLLKTDPRVLSRYMGREEAIEYRRALLSLHAEFSCQHSV